MFNSKVLSAKRIFSITFIITPEIYAISADMSYLHHPNLVARSLFLKKLLSSLTLIAKRCAEDMVGTIHYKTWIWQDFFVTLFVLVTEKK